jgi:curli biogenesis system outer membrane secretion channel CsgG
MKTAWVAIVLSLCTLAQHAGAQDSASAGPKKRVAVAKFDAAGSFVSQYGAWDIGGGLAAQLTTALVESGRFIVVERAELASVLREQEMGLQKIAARETAAQAGRVTGAQVLVRGSVTEFDQKTAGDGFRIGLGRASRGAGIGVQSSEGIVGMDIRLIDTTTGQVLQSHRVQEKISASGVAADINIRQLTFGGDSFNKTELGQATRQAIEKAVALIVRSIEPVPWTGRVVDVSGSDVYVNAGAAENIRPGQRMKVSSIVRELTDPSSGELLGIEEQPLGMIEVTSVQPKFSVARMPEPFQAKRGDLVRFVGP